MSEAVRARACAQARRALRSGAAIAALAVLTLACSGGGGGGTSLSVTPSSLEFEAEQGGGTPLAKAITATFVGDGLVAGFPQGAPVPGWLAMEFTGQEGSPQAISVRVTTTSLQPGDHTATVRIVTGKSDGTQLVTRDVPVRYRVHQGLTVNATSLAFSSTEGLRPAAQTITLQSGASPTASYSVSVESRGGPSDWLPAPASPIQLSGGTAAVQVQPLGRPAGAYAADLVFRDQAGIVRARIPVSHAVAAAYAVGGPISASVTHAASPADLERALTVSSLVDAAAGAGYQWTLSSSAPWVSASPSAGDLSADTALAVRLDPDQLWALANGTHSATLTLTFSAGGARTAQIPVSLQLALAPALQVTALADLAVARTTTAAELSRAVTVTSNLGAAFASRGGWTAATDASWLTVTPAGATLTVEAQPTALAALGNGVHVENVTVQPTSSRVSAASTQARLLLALPAVGHVAPYATWVSRTDPVILRGSGFGTGGTTPVSFGAVTVDGTIVSDTEVRVAAPAVSNLGTVPVAIENALGLDRGASQLTVLPAPGYTAHAAPLGKLYQRLTLDPERQAVLLTGWGGTDVRRVRFEEGAWSVDAYAVANASSVEVTLDGKDLLVTAGTTGTPELFLEVDPVTLALRKSTAFADFYGTFDVVAGLNDGRTMIVDSEQWAETIWYPSLAAGPRPSAHNPFALVTRDRSRVVLRGTSSGADTFSFDAAGTTFTSRVVSSAWSTPSHWAVSGDGGRLLAHTSLYDGSFAYLGELSVPEANITAVALAPDGRSAYTAGRGASGSPWVFRRTGVAGGAPYTAGATPLAISVPSDQLVHLLRVSEDGSTLFVLATAASGTETVFHALPLP